MNDLFIQQIRLKPDMTVGDRLQNLFPLELSNSITVFIGENGAGNPHYLKLLPSSQAAIQKAVGRISISRLRILIQNCTKA
ncbi:hypothetical protein [Pseudomonas atacamensis]|uniref:hypothetical protein n=1 Tax=Pseudomonas atacamensis TaxID=2565368 RepID=UPI00300EF080